MKQTKRDFVGSEMKRRSRQHLMCNKKGGDF